MTAPVLIPTAATAPIVTDAYDRWSNVASSAFAQAQALAGQVATVTFTPVNFNIPFNAPSALGPYPTIAAPSQPGFNYTPPPVPPDSPSVDWGNYIPGSNEPQFTGGDLGTILAPNFPQLQALQPLPAQPTLTNPTIPAAPNIALPAPPTLDIFTVPNLPAITIPAFTAVAPTFNVPVPVQNFSFSPAVYVDDLLTTTKATIKSMQAGNFVLPAAVAAALRNRAFDAANREETREIDEAYSEFAARGFEEPPGLLNKRLVEIHDKAQLARMGANRDIYIQDQLIALENQREGVKAGVQLEGQLIQLYTVQTQYQFESAKFALESAIQIFQARISQYNAQVQAFVAQASAFRDQMEGVLAQVRVYHEQMEGLRVRGELNIQRVEVYKAQLAGVNELVEIYRAQVGGAEAAARVNASIVEAYSAEVGAIRTQIEAQNLQWVGYKTQIDAQLARAQFYQTSVNAFSARLQAWTTSETTKQKAAELKIEASKGQIETWRTKVQLYEEKLKTELARVGVIKDTYQSSVELYKANASVAASAAEYNNRTLQLNIEKERARVDTALKAAEQNFEQMKYATSVVLEIKKTLATVEAQLAASAMNAVHIGASLTSSNSASIGWQTQISSSF